MSAREPELWVDEPVCAEVWITYGRRHACHLMPGHTGACECEATNCAATNGGAS